MKVLPYFIAVAGFLSILTCSPKTPSKLVNTTSSYKAAIKNWQAERAAAVTAPTGWLSLMGLFWLKEGKSSFGAHPSNKIVFPENSPNNIGAFILSGGQVYMEVEPSVPVEVGTATPKKIAMVPDNSGAPTLAELGTLKWHLIKRENRFGIRLKDTASTSIKSFTSIPYFPINQRWQIPAILKPATAKKYVTLKNVVEMDVSMKLEGYLVFELAGITYELEAMDGGNQGYFVIFSDETTSLSTYGGGRYLYVPRADEQGRTLIDFNKAYNPPCVFTDFATCPLPSEKNYMELSITAGEKDYH